MTENTYEKQIMELGEEMDRKLLLIEGGADVSLAHLVDDAIKLRAGFQDIRASAAGFAPNSALASQQIHTSDMARREYTRGKSELINARPDDTRDEIVQEVVRILASHPPYDTVCYPPIIRVATGISQQERQRFKSLKQDLERADVQDHVLAFLFGECMHTSARKLLYERLRRLLMKDLNLSINYSHPDVFWQDVLIGIDKNGMKSHDGIEFLLGFVERMDTITNDGARLLYGEQAPRALALWRSILSIEGRITPRLKDFRQRCAAALIVPDQLDMAEDTLAKTYANESPFSFSDETRAYIKEHIPLQQKQQPQPPAPTPSELQKRFAKQLDYFRPLIGKIFRTQGGRMVEITALGEGIRYTNRGWRPGVIITPLRKDKLSGRYIKTDPIILLPSTLAAKMEHEAWTET